MTEDFEKAIHEHDEAVARTRVEIWIGAEPTFTDRGSSDPAWLVDALGADKEARARALLAELRDALVDAALHPRFAREAEGIRRGEVGAKRGVMLRTVGRRYPGEERPRWSYGLFCLRDGAPVWDGPRDPFESRGGAELARAAEPEDEAEDCAGRGAEAGADAEAGAGNENENGARGTGQGAPEASGKESPKVDDGAAERFRDVLAEVLKGEGRTVGTFAVDGELRHRLVYRTDGKDVQADPAADARLGRSSFHTPPKDEVAPVDALASEGAYLVCVGMETTEDDVVRVEIPGLPDVPAFIALLQDLGESARRIGLDALVLAGGPPPVNPSAAWTTVTPDPGVVEVNMAPAPNVSTFYEWMQGLHGASGRHGLAAERYWYNGDVADSGGGGHLTLGGPTAQRSPFFVKPRLLPALIAYLNHHPCLSYLFAVDSLGSSSQSPRPDEVVRESFEELKVALALLSQLEQPQPEQLWAALAPFLADRFGNVHRAEVNIEKLWNPYLPGRGRWGVVELRALRMPPTAERAAALAALFRALAAMLAQSTEAPSLLDWGATLHDRFALPFFLERDLESVLSDLDAAGLGLPEALSELLRDSDHRLIGVAPLDHARLTVRRGIEFWPLVGDPTVQEARTARLIDSSTRRLELVLRPTDGAYEDELSDWRVSVAGVQVPMALEHDAYGAALVLGVRYRAFVPTPGLHPTLGKQMPLEIGVHHRGYAEATRITLHDWRPGGGSYDGLPRDAKEARERRVERFVIETVDPDDLTFDDAPPDAVTAHALDLRRRA